MPSVQGIQNLRERQMRTIIEAIPFLGAGKMFTHGTEMAFPAYLMKGERIEFDGEIYVIPEPVACHSLKDLVIFLYDRGVRPLREHSPGD